MRFPNFNPKTRQQGAATLIVVTVLAIIMGVIALTTARTGFMEQKITGNDLRAREAQEAAEAGLEYGVAWAQKNKIPNDVTCSLGVLPTGCPTALTTVIGSSTGETYNYVLTYDVGTDSIKITSEAKGVADDSISAISETTIKQIPIELFELGLPMPPPWVLAGCMPNGPTGTPDTFVLNSTNVAVITGSSTDLIDCLPQGHLGVATWNDANANGVMDPGEEGAATTFNRGSFSGCPSPNCAWNSQFKMDLEEAKNKAIDAGHVYSALIPCGPATSSPSIYIIENGGPINSADMDGECEDIIIGVDDNTIGAPNQPILLIVPATYGCPRFDGGITIYGIVYYESMTACAANGWGGATVHGSVIWEGDVNRPNSNSQFIEVNYDNNNLNEVFKMGIDDATRIPGTWKDF